MPDTVTVAAECSLELCGHSPSKAHCWHRIGSELEAEYRDWQRCCHCGVNRVVVFGQPWPREHGPYKPDSSA